MKSSESKPPLNKLASLFSTLGQSARLRILLTIGESEACVCHLEAALDYRQAYISQQLMALRSASLVTPRREGRNIYYRLADPRLLELILRAAEQLRLPQESLRYAQVGEVVANCCCPHCSPGADLIQPEQVNPATTKST